MWWFHVGFGSIVLVYIHRCCSHAEQRLEEMLQGRFLPGGLSMQKKATMLQTTIAEIYLNKKEYFCCNISQKQCKTFFCIIEYWWIFASFLKMIEVAYSMMPSAFMTVILVEILEELWCHLLLKNRGWWYFSTSPVGISVLKAECLKYYWRILIKLLVRKTMSSSIIPFTNMSQP